MFTTAIVATATLAVVVWLFMIFCDEPLLRLLGSDGELLEIGLTYLKPLKAVIPVFIFSQMLAAYLRNDNDPGLAIAPAILRKYGIGYLFAPFTLFATYYFQSILKTRTSMGVSFSRGLIIGGVMLYVLPAIFGADSLWFAMPVAEISVAVVTVLLMWHFTQKLDAKA